MRDVLAAHLATRFRDAPVGTPWPALFIIITACAPTGETWSDTEEAAADARLRAELVARGAWHVRPTGYHPATGRARNTSARARLGQREAAAGEHKRGVQHLPLGTRGPRRAP